MSMKRPPWEVSDELWELVEPLLPGQRASVQIPGSQAVPGPAGAVRDPVCAAYGDRVDALAPGARLRVGLHLLAAAGGVAAGRGVGQAAPVAPFAVARGG